MAVQHSIENAPEVGVLRPPRLAGGQEGSNARPLRQGEFVPACHVASWAGVCHHSAAPQGAQFLSTHQLWLGWDSDSEIGFRTLRAHAALERAKRLQRSQ